MKLFAISDIHGATKPIEKAATLISEADWVVISAWGPGVLGSWGQVLKNQFSL
jgi:hypothetical protein